MKPAVPRSLALIAAIALAAVTAPAALAAPPVTNTNDSGPGSLRNAIDNAGPTDTIDIPPLGTYQLTSGQLLIDNATKLTLVGTGGAAATRIQATGAFRVICIAGGLEVVISGVTITGGRAAASAPCADGQGGGIHSAGTGTLTVSQSVIEGNSATASQGGGGGIFKAGDLFIDDTTVRNNSSAATGAAGSNGGGGIRWTGSGFPSFVVRNSTISGNAATVAGPNSGGGGIYSQAGPTLENVTVSGNRLAVQGSPRADGGGAGLYARTGAGPATVNQATFAGNVAGQPGGAIADDGIAIRLSNSVLDRNSAPAGAACAPGAVVSLGGNVESSATCDPGATDKPDTDPQLGPLALNGSANGTQTHELLARSSPAVELAKTGCSRPDQRGVGKFGTFCDSGAYEYDGRASAAIPDCSPTGRIPIKLDDPPDGDVIGMKYTLNGGSDQQLDTGPTASGPFTTILPLSEGRYRLEYWGLWTNGVERGHNVGTVLVDQTRPSVEVANPNPFRVFVIKRRVNVAVNASDSLSGLVTDPSGVRGLDTAGRGAKTFAPEAVDLCTNAAMAPFSYRVLAPDLGVRTVLERVTGTVLAQPAAGGGAARASQKGRSFTAIDEPREVAVRSLINTRRGTVRLTSSRDARTGIQDGEFAGGVFQVRQSGKRSARGLTELRLKGSSFRGCSRSVAGRRASTAAGRRVIRRLRGSGRGRFRTRGRFSAATVRGTTWTVEDRCDGTLTRVTRGTVAVRDFRRRRTIAVRAGKSYLARAPG